jgi:hypothetical protein
MALLQAIRGVLHPAKDLQLQGLSTLYAALGPSRGTCQQAAAQKRPVRPPAELRSQQGGKGAPEEDGAQDLGGKNLEDMSIDDFLNGGFMEAQPGADADQQAGSDGGYFPSARLVGSAGLLCLAEISCYACY